MNSATLQKSMTADAFYDAVINKTISMQLSPPLLSRLRDMDLQALHYLFSQIYYFVQDFPALLGALIWQMSDERIRFALADNLIDELGGSENIRKRDFSQTHSRLLKRFIQGINQLLNQQSDELAPRSVHTEILLASFDRLFLHSTPLEALSAVATMEGTSSEWFNLLYKQLLDRKEFSEEALYFFELHTRLDDEHGSILKEVLLPSLIDAKSFALFKHGAISAASFWGTFYASLAEELAQ
jgi:pyrroloquinoline-quinone synthase